MQSFLEKINFVRRFISGFMEIVKPLQEMIKKDSNFKWIKEINEAFYKIKESIVDSSTLRSPNFGKKLILYTFCFHHSIVAMLTQKREVGEEFLASFMRKGLQGVEINFPTIDM